MIKKYTKNFKVQIDDQDSHILNLPGWYIDEKLYLSRIVKIDGIRKHLYLHREILNALPSEIVDHINGDRLDNRRCNLRLVSALENMRNQAKTRHRKTSQYKGVCFSKSKRLWRAYIKSQQRQIALGYFESEIEAAKAYNVAAQKYFGQYCKLNAI